MKECKVLKEERAIFISEMAKAILERWEKFFDNLVEKGCFQFWEESKISFELREVLELAKKIFEEKELSIEKNSKLAEEILEIAENQLNDILEAAGWTICQNEEDSWIEQLDAEKTEPIV